MISETVHVASIANDDDLSLQKFMKSFLCLLAPPRPNTSTRFRLVDASQLPLKNSPSPLKAAALAELLFKYPGPIQVHLPMIIRFGVELGYEGPTDAFILSENLASTLEDTEIIDNKLRNDLALQRVVEVKAPAPPFISSPLGLVPKHDGGWRKIHHLSHLRGHSVNSQIPDGAGEMRYTRFQDSLRMVTKAGKNCVIRKRDVKDAFRNLPVALQHQWLLGFKWRNKHYKEPCLSFGLSTAPFIFNLFGEGLHWILVSYLRWILVHYLDDFIAIFTATQATSNRMRKEARAYVWVTDLLGISRNDSKDRERTQITVFGIEVDKSSFTARLPPEKLEKAIKATAKVLAEQFVSFLDIQSLVGFLSFCYQAVRLSYFFMRRL